MFTGVRQFLGVALVGSCIGCERHSGIMRNLLLHPRAPQLPIRGLKGLHISFGISQHRALDTRSQGAAQDRQGFPVERFANRQRHICILRFGNPVGQPQRRQDRGRAPPGDRRKAQRDDRNHKPNFNSQFRRTGKLNLVLLIGG
jgi:hypothetical protein